MIIERPQVTLHMQNDCVNIKIYPNIKEYTLAFIINTKL